MGVSNELCEICGYYSPNSNPLPCQLQLGWDKTHHVYGLSYKSIFGVRAGLSIHSPGSIIGKSRIPNCLLVSSEMPPSSLSVALAR